MDIQGSFLTRYRELHGSYLPYIWENVTHAQMHQQPDPRTNTIAWNLWHMLRAEDAGLNRFVTDGSQVLDDGNWNSKLGLSNRDVGSGMTNEEAAALGRQIRLDSLKEYGEAVYRRTLSILPSLTPALLDEVLDDRHRLCVLDDEGYLPRFDTAYQGWTKGKCLMHLGLTHHFEHVGVIGTLAGLLGIEL